MSLTPLESDWKCFCGEVRLCGLSLCNTVHTNTYVANKIQHTEIAYKSNEKKNVFVVEGGVEQLFVSLFGIASIVINSVDYKLILR